MTGRMTIFGVASWLVFSSWCWADSVKTRSATLTGRVTGMSATEVTIEQTNGGTKAVPVNEIELISYDAESVHLKTARTAMTARRYEDALEAIERVKLSENSRPEIQQDVEFYQAMGVAKLALAGARPISEAGKTMLDFVASHPNSYHYLEACEVVGDLLVASNKHSLAQKYYGELARAPWPDYQMRAGVAMGRALTAEGKFDEAMQAFQRVISTAAAGQTADRQRLAATIGQARCFAGAGKTDQAIAIAQGLIDKADADATDLYAKAYNALGVAYRKAGRPKDALMAFLHTDLLYSDSREDHVEALENLVELWGELKRPERAAQTQAALTQQYGNGAGSGATSGSEP